MYKTSSLEVVTEYGKIQAQLKPLHEEIVARIVHVLLVVKKKNRNNDWMDGFDIDRPEFFASFDSHILVRINASRQTYVDDQRHLHLPISLLDASDDEILKYFFQLDWEEAIEMNKRFDEIEKSLEASEREYYKRLKAKFEGGNNG